MLIRAVCLSAVLLASFLLVSGLEDTPESIDEAIQNVGHGRRVKRGSGQEDRVSDGTDMTMTKKQFKRLYAGVRGRDDGNLAATPWTDGIVHYNIYPGSFDDEQRQKIREAMAAWESVSCVRFQEAQPGEEDNLRYFATIYSGQQGCNAELGMTSRGQHINLHSTCFWRGTIEHEFGHTLGLVHEHQRAERDQYLRVNYYAADPDFVSSLMKFAEGTDDKMGLEYDYYSVMHYGKNAFGDDRGLQTLYPRDRSMTDVIGQAMKPSYLDAKLVNLMYKCSDRCRRPRRCPRDCFLTADCSCLCKHQFQENCRDELPTCEAEAEKGMCTRDMITMQTYCRKSCGLCRDPSSRDRDPYLRTCVNKDENCEQYQQEGMCEHDPDFMKRNCPLACGWCTVTGNTYRIPGPCRDTNITCRRLARDGQCERHPETMLVDCRRSCNFCPDDMHRPMPRPGRCEDTDSICTYWKEVGKCVTDPLTVGRKCVGACNTCNKNFGIPQGCRDYDDGCLGWTVEGQCDTVTEFMNQTCPLSCGFCPGLPKVDFNRIRGDLHYRCSEWGVEECTKTFGFMRIYCRETCREEILRNGDCFDDYDWCPKNARDGECFTDPNFTLKKCRKSCGQCGELARTWTTPRPGSDMHVKCPNWAADGECERIPVWMNMYCMESCVRCQTDPSTCTTQAPVIVCEDGDPEGRCPKWAADGRCTEGSTFDINYTQNTCKKSCGLCQ